MPGDNEVVPSVRAEDVRDQVRQILVDVLGEVAKTQDNPSRETVSEWDSLRHVEILFAVEDELNAHFAAEELPLLSSLDAIVDVIVANG